MAIDLSVLIPSTHTRWDSFGQKIQRQIWGQYDDLTEADRQRVEILILTDNKTRHLGDKRNVMVDMAQGRYVVHVDDDDRLNPTYITSLLAAAATDADVITFDVSVSLNGSTPKLCRYSLDYRADRNLADGYERLPNHLMPVRRELALQAPFQPILKGEDSAYARDIRPLLTTEHHIDRVLYHYDYSDATTETQQRIPRPAKHTPPPIADVIILSKADNSTLRQMTQAAIDTCIAGAQPLSVHVTVIEQCEGVTYRQADTHHTDDPFAFNALLNRGARLGSAPWIMFSNNDVEYGDGWLSALLDAHHPIVSPIEPTDARMQDVDGNEVGDRIGRHLAGWAFMMERELWEQIGGLDEDFAGWCADDAVIEQLRPLDILPMLVPAAVVKHHGSITLNTSPDYTALTWGGIELFERKYGPHRLGQHPSFLAWKAEVLADAG